MTVKELALVVGKFMLVTVTLFVPALMSGDVMPVVFATGIILFMAVINMVNEFMDAETICNNEYFIIGVWVYFVVSCIIAYVGINVSVLQPIVFGVVVVYSLFFLGRYIYLKGK